MYADCSAGAETVESDGHPFKVWVYLPCALASLVLWCLWAVKLTQAKGLEPGAHIPI